MGTGNGLDGVVMDARGDPPALLLPGLDEVSEQQLTVPVGGDQDVQGSLEGELSAPRLGHVADGHHYQRPVCRGDGDDVDLSGEPTGVAAAPDQFTAAAAPILVVVNGDERQPLIRKQP